jgi:hypothetical protein
VTILCDGRHVGCCGWRGEREKGKI